MVLFYFHEKGENMKVPVTEFKAEPGLEPEVTVVKKEPGLEQIEQPVREKPSTSISATEVNCIRVALIRNCFCFLGLDIFISPFSL